MFQIARDLGLEHKSGSMVFPLGITRLDLLERHLALELGIPRHPDLAYSPACMRPNQLKARSHGGPVRISRATHLWHPLRVWVCGEGRAAIAPERRVQRRPQRIVDNLGQHILSQLSGIPRIHTPPEVVVMHLEVSRSQTFQGMDMVVIEGGCLLQQFSQWLLPILRPRLQGRGKTGTGNGIRQKREHGNE